MTDPSLEAKLAALQARLDALEQHRPPEPAPRRRWLRTSVATALLAASVTVAAVPVTLLPNTPALASELMQNFNDLDTRLTALTTSLASTRTELSGSIAFFTIPCPGGWVPYTAAQGRFIVGTPDLGNNGRQVGAAQFDGEVRTHSHAWADFVPVSGSINRWQTWNSAGTQVTAMDWDNGLDNAGSGIYPFGIETASPVQTTFYTTRNATGLPYVQLTACRKL